MGGGPNLATYIIYLEVYLSLSLSMYISPIWYRPNLWSIRP